MLNSIQILRALAAWLVVGHHTMQIFFNFKSTNFLTHFFSEWGDIGVDVFFIVSGFVIFLSSHRKQRASIEFIRNRLVRIVPAYWVATVVTLLTLWWLPELSQQMHYNFSVVHTLLSSFFIPWPHPGGIGYYPVVTMGWTLNFEMMFYLIFALTLVVSKHRRVTALIFGVLTVFFGLPAIGLLSSFYSNNIALEFLAGVGIGVLWSKKKITFSWKKSAIFFLLAGVLMYLLRDAERVFRFGIPSVCVVLGSLYLEDKIKKSMVLCKLGDLSYSTYLFHGIILYLGFYLAQRTQISSELLIVASYFILLLVSLLSYTYLELRVSGRLQRKSLALPTGV